MLKRELCKNLKRELCKNNYSMSKPYSHELDVMECHMNLQIRSLLAMATSSERFSPDSVENTATWW